jgi:hypothetical protein
LHGGISKHRISRLLHNVLLAESKVIREEGGGEREEGRGKREEGRGKREEGRGKREEGRGKREEGRGEERNQEIGNMCLILFGQIGSNTCYYYLSA